MAAALLLLILLIGASFVGLTLHYAEQYFAETQQHLHAHLAQHLIDEKFQASTPFLADGSVNKPLFGDIMHDMMAVNRSIEVYLLGPEGQVRYSVVLDEQRMSEGEFSVDLVPVRQFLDSGGEAFVLGQDPLSPTETRIFSAAAFEQDGQQGYIYIILAGQQWQTWSEHVLGSYTLQGGLIALSLALSFALLLGLLLLGYLTRRLRKLTSAMQQFEDGHMQARIDLAGHDEIAQLGHHFNRMADAIWRNFEAIKSTERLRQDLIANVSHDLRTPLAVIHGYAETLQIKGDQVVEADRERYIRVILRNATKLKKLVSELFELSKLEAKQVVPKPEAVPLSNLLTELGEQYQMLAQEKGLHFRIEQTPLPWQHVWVDLALIERVCQNLLDNAIKFTPEGGEVRLRVFPGQSAGTIAVEVSDTGVGISAEDLPHIFNRYTTRNRQDQPQTGTGLGLAIASKIMELHASTLEVSSRLREGTRFVFELEGR
jgi:signal transduction histidine kinase